MTKQTLLFLALIFTACGYGQTELQFNISTKYQPTDWMSLDEPHPDLDRREHFTYWPVFQADLGMRQYISRSSWFWEAGMSFRHTRQIFEWDFSQFANDPEFDSPVPNSQEDPPSITDHLNYAGVKIGGGYRISSRNQKHALILPLGLQCHVPAGSKKISTFSSPKTSNSLYTAEDFEKGIYYGLYFKPSWEFSLSGKRSNPWRFSLYAEGDALIHHTSEVNPKFLWGGGMGVSYRIGKSL